MTKSLRETLGASFASASLTWARDGSESDVDRLVASAWCTGELGRRLARLKYGGDTTTLTRRKALWLLVEKSEQRGRYGKERPSNALIAMCDAVIDEWLDDRCKATGCTAGWIRAATPPHPCPRCNGVGRTAWTDEQRQERCKGMYHIRQYEKILRRLQEADQQHNNQTRKGLAP